VVSAPTAWFAPLASPRTCLSILYLSTRFLPGIFYVLVLSVGLACAAGSTMLVGLPLLAGTLALLWSCAKFERDLTTWWLGVELPPMRPPPAEGQAALPGLAPAGWLRRLRDHLGLSVTWKSMVYLLLQLPMGLIAFLLLAAALALPLALVAAPAFYVADALTFSGRPGSFQGPLLWITGSSGHLDGFGLAVTALLFVVGGLLLAGAVELVNRGAGAELQVGEARRAAAQERQRAERADRSRRELIVNLSHELRTPIASIRGHAEALRPPGGARPDRATADRYVEVIARETERLGALVDELMSLARAEADELHLSVEAVRVEEVVEEAERAVAAIAQHERRVKVARVPPAGPLPPVLADRDRLLQVLLNLLRNAVAHTPEGGLVTIEAGPAGEGQVAIEVADTGVGIEEEALERVFDRFYRADSSRSRHTGGFGLGLSIARDLVEAMGGTVTAESTVGRGSRFRVLLRVA
jgi:two-component system, OmpR family, phosphate regulon sensor histidine kinase PhoR